MAASILRRGSFQGATAVVDSARYRWMQICQPAAQVACRTYAAAAGEKKIHIMTIGSSPPHATLSKELLTLSGFGNFCCVAPAGIEAMKAEIARKTVHYDVVLLGGAMPKAFPKERDDLIAFIKKESPASVIHQATPADYSADAPMPPRAEDVATSVLKLALLMRSVAANNAA